MNKINHLGSVQRRSTKSTISSSSVAKWRKQHRYTSAQTHLLCFGRSTDSRRFFRNRICDIMMGLKETRCTRHPSSGRPPTLRMKGGGEHGHLYQQNREHTHTHTPPAGPDDTTFGGGAPFFGGGGAAPRALAFIFSLARRTA